MNKQSIGSAKISGFAALYLFLISTVICFTISSFSKSLFLSADEMRYIGIARAIANGRGATYIHHMVTDYQKILYPIFISVAYRFRDFHLQVTIVGLINALLMSSSVFPAYLLARRYLKSSKQVLIVCVFTVLYPELAMTMTFMSENLYFPMVLWEIYFIDRLFGEPENNGYLSVILGIWTYLLYLCKEVGICFLIGYILSEIFMALRKRNIDRDFWKRLLIPLLFFCFLFFCAKCTVFSEMGNSYDQTSIEAILSGQAVLYFLYACIYYLIYVIVSFYFFPILFCIFKWTELPEKTKKMFSFLIFMIIVMIGTVGYTISIREDLGSLSPHLHLRYFSPLVIPFLIIFMQSIQNIQNFILKKGQKYFIIVFCVLLFVVPNICQRGLMDSQNMEFYRCIGIAMTKLFGKSGDILSFLLVKLLWLVMLLGGYYLLRKKPEKFFQYFITATLALNIVNYGLKYAEVRMFYSVDRAAVSEMQELNEKLNSLSGNKLLIGKYLTDQNMELADTYLDDEELYYTSSAVIDQWEEAYPDRIPCTWPSENYEDMKNIEYFVIDNEIDHTAIGIKELIWQGNYFSIWRG